MWPQFNLPKFEWNMTAFEALCGDGDSLVRSICSDFIPLVKDAILKINHYATGLEDKLSQIHDLYGLQLEKDDSEPRLRQATSETNDLLKSSNKSYKLVIDDSYWDIEDVLSVGLSATIPVVGGAYSNLIRAKRDRIFRTAIQSLVARHNLIKDSFIDMKQDLVLALNIVGDTFINTTNNIRYLHSRINSTNSRILQSIRECH